MGNFFASLPLDELELSVRTRNGLKRLGVETIGDFMELDEKTVRSAKNCGARTWREVSDLQENLRPPTPEEQFENAWGDAVRAVRLLNEVMRRNPEIRVAVVEQGQVLVYVTDAAAARGRFK